MLRFAVSKALAGAWRIGFLRRHWHASGVHADKGEAKSETLGCGPHVMPYPPQPADGSSHRAQAELAACLERALETGAQIGAEISGVLNAHRHSQ